MPEVPYRPFPTVQPTERKIPGVSVSFPQVNFTRSIGTALSDLGRSREVLGNATIGVGAALGSLGKSIEGAGDEIWNRAVAIKQVEQQTAATEADTKFMMESAQRDADFQNQTGNAAAGGLQAHMQGLENLRQQIRAGLPSDYARHSYDQMSLRTLGRTVFWAAHHAAAQGKAAALGAATANFKMGLSDLENHAENMSDEEFTQRKQEAFDNYDKVIAPLEGIGKGPQAELRRMEINTQLEGARIMGIGKHDPDRALAELKALKDKNEILSPAAEKIENTLNEKRIDVASRYEADKVTSWMYDKTRDPNEPPKPITKMVQEAQRSLPEDLRDLPEARERVERNVENAVRRYEYANNRSKVDGFDYITGKFYDQQGQLKPSLDAVKADPQAAAMYDSLPRTGTHSQKAIRDAFDLAVRKGERVDTYTSGQSLQYIKGLRDHSPESRDKLMDMNLYDRNLKDENGNPLRFNDVDRRAAIKLRDSLKTNPNGDPRVNRAWGWLRESRSKEMDALGLLTTNQTDPNIISAKGMLGDALEAYEDTHKGVVPDYKVVVDEIGKRLLAHKLGSWYPWQGSEDPMYKTAVPSAKWKADFISDFKAKRGIEPTESEIFHSYNQAIWRELYQGGGITAPAPKAKKVQETAPEVGE